MGSKEYFELVWAKQRYSCYWPARIIRAPPQMGKTPKNQICVLFFGTKQFGFVDKKNIENYKQFREKFVNKGRKLANFRRAVVEMDEFISDPQEYRQNAFAREIQIKTEESIQRELGIKIENNDSLNTNKEGILPIKYDDSHIESLVREKNALIATIISLKSENQTFCFQLNEKKSKLITLKAQNENILRELNAQIVTLSSDLKNALAELSTLKRKFHEQKASDEKSIANLVAEKKLLAARFKQLGNGASLQHSLHCNEQSDDENIYEVEKLLADKFIRRTRYYLVRWKGYGPTYDSWEKEENILCQSILEEYQESKFKNE